MLVFPRMATAAVTPLSVKDVFRQKPFRKLWLAQFVSVFGDFLALFGIISFIVFRLHGTAVNVTAVIIAFALPLALAGPPAGVLVDRWNVKKVMIASDLIRALLIVLLVLVTDIREICAIFALLSFVSSFFGPAQAVTLRTLVPTEGLLAANAMMTQAFYAVRILSPALAGALVAWLGEKSTFYLDSASFVFSACIIASLTIIRPEQAQQRGKNLKALTADLVEGNKFIFTHSGLAFVFLAMSVAMFVLSSFSPLVSIYIRDSLHAGSFLFGMISSMVGVGLIAGTQLVTRLARKRKGSSVVLTGLALMGVGAGLLGAFRNIPMAAASTFTIGIAIAFVWIPAQTMSQQETPPAMVGRVSSTFMSLISMSQVLGLILSGYLAQILGIRTLFMVSAGFVALIAAGGYLWLRGRPDPSAVATG
jgi:MFS transporter, DHA3 family, macrolide efflux protein